MHRCVHVFHMPKWVVGTYTEIGTSQSQYNTYTIEFYVSIFVSIESSVPARVDDCIPRTIKVLAKSDWVQLYT